MNCKCKHEILTVPKGNKFRIHLCRKDIAPRNLYDVDFSAIVGLEAYATRVPDVRIPLQAEVDTDGDLLITIMGDANKLTTYGVELVGKYNGHNWRWKCREVFRRSDTNCESTVQGMESFDVETYYLWDTLDFVIKEDTLDIISDSHAWIENDVLHVMDTDSTTVTFNGDKMIVTTD